MTLLLAWRKPPPAISTQWRGPNRHALVQPAQPPLPHIATIIGPPGPAGSFGNGPIDGGTFN